MNRRNFIRNSSLASFSVTAISAGSTEASKTSLLDASIPPFSLEEITIDVLQEKMQKGQLTAVALLGAISLVLKISIDLFSVVYLIELEII
ncbi:MAG: hypothetical protein K9I82_06065 [Chitinophagaceae bacterium]|nr:hypothetical protein [Chitinophagaceae bacterium]